MKKYILIGLALTLFCACSPKDFKTRTLSYADSTSYCHTSISVDLPTGNSSVEKRIRKSLISTLDTSTRFFGIYNEGSELFPPYAGRMSDVDACVDYYAHNLIETTDRIAQEEETYNPWECEISIKLTRLTDRYVVFDNSDYVYMGGAHGGVVGDGPLTFNLANGKLVEKFIEDSALEPLQEAMRKGLLEYFNEDGEEIPAEELFGMTFIEDGSIPFPAYQPEPCETGLTFIYQQYEIAPYAFGMPTFTIPYEILAPYLTKEARAVLE